MNQKRKSISKKSRFEVFKRDNFTCQYCSAKPPKVPLEIDHIIPVSKGGGNRIDNLVTACFDCNRGKSNIELDNIPQPLSEKMELKKIAQTQYAQYKRILNKEKKIINNQIDQVQDVYGSYYEGYVFKDKFRLTVKKFINALDIEDVCDSMEKSCSKIYYDKDSVLKYFCGICWNKIKGDGYGY